MMKARDICPSKNDCTTDRICLGPEEPIHYKCAVRRTHTVVPSPTFIVLTFEICALEVFIYKYHQTSILSLVKFKSHGRL